MTLPVNIKIVIPFAVLLALISFQTCLSYSFEFEVEIPETPRLELDKIRPLLPKSFARIVAQKADGSLSTDIAYFVTKKGALLTRRSLLKNASEIFVITYHGDTLRVLDSLADFQLDPPQAQGDHQDGQHLERKISPLPRRGDGGSGGRWCLRHVHLPRVGSTSPAGIDRTPPHPGSPA